MNILHLPPEIVLKILQNLSPTDLKNNMLVCRRLKVIAENSRLWSWCTIDIESVADLPKLKMIRAENIEKICLENCPPKELNDVLKALEDQNLKIIKGFAFKNLSYVEPKLLANMVNKVEEAECFFFTKITDKQAEEVFHNMGKGTKLKRLQITNRHILNVQPEILGLAINKLENLFLEDALKNYGPAFTQEQIIGIFTAMSHGTNLKELILLDIDIALIEPSTLASALSKVEEVRIWRSFLRTGSFDISMQQAQELFRILSEETKLKRLFLLTRNMVNIDPGVLAKALNNLEEITLSHNMITDIQARSLFKKMTEKTFLQKLTIMKINLSSIQSNILAKGVTQIKELIMVDCNLTSEQLVAVFEGIQLGCSMQILDVSNNRLSSLDPELLAKAINRLTKIIIDNNKLNFNQITRILSLCTEKTKLKKMIIRKTNMADIEPELLGRAVNNLEVVGLDGCCLTPEQVNCILKLCSEERSKLKNVDFVSEDLRYVDTELLEQIANKFEIDIELGVYDNPD